MQPATPREPGDPQINHGGEPMKKCLGVLVLSLGASFAFGIDPGTNYVPPACQGGVFNDVACPGQMMYRSTSEATVCASSVVCASM